MYKHIFGPVPSRRLGVSLGIDLVPLKTCNLNCIYCECGRTTRLTMERREYVPLERVCDELAHNLAVNPAPDYLTFSGSGEPLLHSRTGELIAWIKARFPEIPVAVLTNGTFFTKAAVRAEVLQADLILPSLDAATPAVFAKINRPHPKLQIGQIVDGLVCLRREYHGLIWLEVFIVPGINDQVDELSALRQALARIAPDRVQLNTLDRPGAVSTLRAATQEELVRIIKYWQLPDVEIVARAPFGLGIGAAQQDIEGSILSTIARRPCTLVDLITLLGMHINQVNKYLGTLEAAGKIRRRRQGELDFYELFPDAAELQHDKPGWT